MTLLNEVDLNKQNTVGNCSTGDDFPLGNDNGDEEDG